MRYKVGDVVKVTDVFTYDNLDTNVGTITDVQPWGYMITARWRNKREFTLYFFENEVIGLVNIVPPMTDWDYLFKLADEEVENE